MRKTTVYLPNNSEIARKKNIAQLNDQQMKTHNNEIEASKDSHFLTLYPRFNENKSMCAAFYIFILPAANKKKPSKKHGVEQCYKPKWIDFVHQMQSIKVYVMKLEK